MRFLTLAFTALAVSSLFGFGFALEPYKPRFELFLGLVLSGSLAGLVGIFHFMPRPAPLSSRDAQRHYADLYTMGYLASGLALSGGIGQFFMADRGDALFMAGMGLLCLLTILILLAVFLAEHDPRPARRTTHRVVPPAEKLAELERQRQLQKPL